MTSNKLNDYSITANQYALSGNAGTAYLAFKKIPDLIKKYANNNNTLDYGCGAGGSTLFLKNLGLKVEGADISSDMIFEATQLNLKIPLHLIESGKLPHSNNTFDIVFSSFVLFEISTKKEMVLILNEIYRVLKKGGIFIAVTGSEVLYRHKWLTLDVDFPQNKNLKSGDVAKVLLKDVDLAVFDYYWRNEDYMNVFEKTPFAILETLHPLGEDIDNFLWQDEKYFPPYVIYTLIK